VPRPPHPHPGARSAGRRPGPPCRGHPAAGDRRPRGVPAAPAPDRAETGRCGRLGAHRQPCGGPAHRAGGGRPAHHGPGVPAQPARGRLRPAARSRRAATVARGQRAGSPRHRRPAVRVPGTVAGLLPRRSDYLLRPAAVRADLLAGLTVGVVALPLALAFGISSGVGAAAGLVTAVVAGIVAAVFGGSHHQVSGPTGAMAVVLAPVVAAHGLGSLALVTLAAGLIVLLLGLARLGRIVTYIPWPVVEGFTLGIACIIFLQQVPAAVGVSADPGHNTLVTALRSVRSAVENADLTLLAWTLGAVLLVAAAMLALPRLHRAIPASLVGVAAAMEHAGEPDGTVYEPDRELVGQGLASLASGLFGGMPATGAIARTAVNIRSGARTRLASVSHALVILAVIYLATGPVSRI